MSVQGLFAAMALAALGTEAAVSAASQAETTGAEATGAEATKAVTSQPVAKAGTPIILEIVDAVSTRSIKRGDTFALKLVAPVLVDGRIIIPAGTPGVGQVVDVGKPGLGGKPAKLVLAGRRLEIEGAQAPIRSFFVGDRGVDTSNTALAVSMVPYVGIASILIQGGHVVIPAGTLARAKLSQDFPASGASAAIAKPSAE